MIGNPEKMSNYRKNYDEIDWRKKIPNTFKTSWGAEYTLMVREEERVDVTKYSSPTLRPTIDDLIDKSRREKLAKK